MNVRRDVVVRQIENYLNDNEINEWISLESIHWFQRLSAFSLGNVVEVLRSSPCRSFELSSFEPICVRRRQFGRSSQTVRVDGLPTDVTENELFEFFQSFYPVERLEMFPSMEKFQGIVQLTFKSTEHAQQFVAQAKNQPMIYMKNHHSRFFTKHRLTCQIVEETRQKMMTPSFFAGKSFSTRLRRDSTRLSSVSNDTLASGPSPTESSISSNSCVTDQILRGQNLPSILIPKFDHPQNLPLVNRPFAYEFYLPDHLFSQIHPCIIISLLNPHCFSLQLRQDAVEFDKFQREINHFYNENDANSRFFVKNDEIATNLCVVCADSKTLSNQTIWNRSQILDFDPVEKTVNLFHVDLGTWEENIPLNRLRRLIETFHEPMVFTLTCRLVHIEPTVSPDGSTFWSDEATQNFQRIIENLSPHVEFLSRQTDGTFRVHLFINFEDNEINVSDYLVHINQAKFVNDDFNDSHPSATHPVVTLYKKSAETSQIHSGAASSCSSSISSFSQTHQPYVKVVPIKFHANAFSHRLQTVRPLIFVRYDKFILVPDFNILTFLNSIDPNFDLNSLENYATSKGTIGFEINAQLHEEIFHQLTPLMNTSPTNHLVLYSLDFVRDILSYYEIPVPNLFAALDEAKRVQIRPVDIIQWFLKEPNIPFPSQRSDVPLNSNQSQKSGHNGRYPTPPIDSRPFSSFSFSNRLF